MNFSVTVLGTASAIPSSKRNPSAQLIDLHSQHFLVDCGEGTQVVLRKNKIRLAKINHIFISHLHGDHIYGLFGLLSTYGLLGRLNTLHIYANERLKELLDFHNQFFDQKLPYEIEFHFLEEGKASIVLDDEKLFVKAFPLKHSMPTHGFLFQEKERLRKLDKQKIEDYNIPVSELLNIKKGADFKTINGEIIANRSLTFDVPVKRAYAYCSDTAYYPNLIHHIGAVDLLYHESTFCNIDADRAKATLHSTAGQAATIAKDSQARKLIIGHFSTRYKKLTPLLEDARAVFKNTEIAEESKTYLIDEQMPQIP